MGSNLVIGIVEDDIIIASSIEKALKELGYHVIPPANTYSEAIEIIARGKPDLIILDILLGKGKDGIDLATKINEGLKIPFIYLTANADKSTIERAKVTMPAAYLIKPFSKYDLYASIEVAIVKFHHSNQEFVPPKVTFIKDGSTMRKISLHEILYLEADHVYLHIYTLHHKFLVRSSMQSFVASLKSKKIMIVHRSYAINLDHIGEIKANGVIINGKEIPLSRTHKNALLAEIKNIT